MAAAPAGQQISDAVSSIADAWGTVIVALLGIIGIVLTQVITNRRERALQERMLQHQTGAELRLRRSDVYAELVSAVNTFALEAHDVSVPQEGGAYIPHSVRAPLNAAHSRAQLFASPSVQQLASALVDAAYAWIDNETKEAWEGLDVAESAFIKGVQAEAEHGNNIGGSARGGG